MTNFQSQCLKANKELKNYIDTKLSNKDLSHTGIIGEGGDISSNIDLIAEKIFEKYLLEIADIYSEESGVIKSGLNNNMQIILDPLDGSDNFLSGVKYYGTSAALQKDGVIVDAFIYNLLDGKYTTKENIYSTPSQSNLAIFERSYKYPQICEKLSLSNIKYRSPGAIALSLANAHNVQFVLFGGSMREFDLAAAMYICGDLNLYKNDKFLLVCKDNEIFEQIKEIIKE